MKILITGGSGFVGSNLTRYFLNRGDAVVGLGRSPGGPGIRHENYRYVAADTTRRGPWQAQFEDADAVVNLAGATIFRRWNERHKQIIYESRILTTRHVVAALPQGKKITLCSASGAGYYGSRGNDVLKEDERPGDDFLAHVSVDWETGALQAVEKGIRVATLRFGVVLGENGGALAKMIPAFKFFVGGPIGDGTQWFPWIHLDDLMAAVAFVFKTETIRGPVNICAPNPVRNRELVKTLGSVLKRPAVVPAPAFMVRLVLGEFGNVLLFSQRTVPDKLLGHGFSFRYPAIRDAVQAVVAGRRNAG